MPYTIFQKETTISADDFDNNWKHIAQGNMLPLGGASLEATTGVYDLGSDIYKWNKVHVQNVHVSGEFQKQMNLIAETTLTTTASAIEFTGLNGETDEIYEIICNVKGYASGSVYMFPNSDSTSNNYGYQYILAQDTSVVGGRGLSLSGIEIGIVGDQTTSALYFKMQSCLYANNNSKLILQKNTTNVGGTFIRQLWTWGYVWNNSATLTSMKFTGYFDPGTNIQLWAKR